MSDSELDTATLGMPEGTTPLTLGELRRMLPRRPSGRPISHTLVHRWIHHGIQGADGTRVRLRAIRVGTRWLTCREWVRDWIAATTAARLGDAGPAVRSPAQRQAASEMAGAELAAAGW